MDTFPKTKFPLRMKEYEKRFIVFSCDVMKRGELRRDNRFATQIH